MSELCRCGKVLPPPGQGFRCPVCGTRYCLPHHGCGHALDAKGRYVHTSVRGRWEPTEARYLESWEA